jgi:hypothetical protein
MKDGWERKIIHCCTRKEKTGTRHLKIDGSEEGSVKGNACCKRRGRNYIHR